MKKQFLALAVLATLATTAVAEVSITQAWARATVAQQKASGAFMTLRSSKDARLISIDTAAASMAELHEMKMDGNTMRMRAVDGIDLPAGKDVVLASGGHHIMLMGLKQQLKDGDTVPMSLTIQGKDGKQETLSIKVPVKPLAYAGKH